MKKLGWTNYCNGVCLPDCWTRFACPIVQNRVPTKLKEEMANEWISFALSLSLSFLFLSLALIYINQPLFSPNNHYRNNTFTQKIYVFFLFSSFSILLYIAEPKLILLILLLLRTRWFFFFIITFTIIVILFCDTWLEVA